MLTELTAEEQRQWLIFYLFIWVIVCILVIRSQWNKKLPSVGLPWMYLFALSMAHFFGALIYAFPWYSPNKNVYLMSVGSSLANTSEGFQQSSYGVMGFGLGSLIIAPWLLKIFNPPWMYEFPRQPILRLITDYMIMGLLFSSVLGPILSRLPSFSSLLVSSSALIPVGICLSCWKSWYLGNKKAFIMWLLVCCCLPLYTLLTTGFMSYGTTAASVVLVFVFNFYRPRWKLIVIGVVTIYLGLSIFVTYFRDRDMIRATPSGGESRVEQMHKTVSNFEFFNPLKREHLERVDGRLNQNPLVGLSVKRISAGLTNYGGGETVTQGLISVIPRILWTNKPVVAGSGDLVPRATGLKVAKGTSMGIGQVLEFYWNFGSMGVFLGFLVFGTIVRAMDITAGHKLNSGNLVGFASWFLPALSLLQPIGSLVDIGQSISSSIVFVCFINSIYFRRTQEKYSLPT